jgi:hypothetical protein
MNVPPMVLDLRGTARGSKPGGVADRATSLGKSCRVGLRCGTLDNDALDRHGHRTTDRVAHRRMPLGESDKLRQILIAAIGLDVHPDMDRLVADWHAVVEREQTLQVDVAGELGRQLAQFDTACRCVQHRRRRDAAGQRVEQEFYGIGSLVVPEQHRRLAIGKDEGLAARRVLRPRAVEVLDCRAVLATVDPPIAGSELELCQGRIVLERADGLAICSRLSRLQVLLICVVMLISFGKG